MSKLKSAGLRDLGGVTALTVAPEEQSRSKTTDCPADERDLPAYRNRFPVGPTSADRAAVAGHAADRPVFAPDRYANLAVDLTLDTFEGSLLIQSDFVPGGDGCPSSPAGQPLPIPIRIKFIKFSELALSLKTAARHLQRGADDGLLVSCAQSCTAVKFLDGTKACDTVRVLHVRITTFHRSRTLWHLRSRVCRRPIRTAFARSRISR
jgi:hypothetical protein